MQARTSRNGWSEQDSDELMAQARQARQAGRPLREVFEAMAFRTGRKPNSIRNYYYARSREEDGVRRAHFKPFTDEEAEQLVEQVLRARASGESVRACVTRLADGDQRLMLRYQNKYRAMLKSRPDVVRSIVERLRRQGLDMPEPTGARRAAASIEGMRVKAGGDKCACAVLDALDKLLDARAAAQEPLRAAAQAALECVRGYLALDAGERDEQWGGFICELVRVSGELEKAL